MRIKYLTLTLFFTFAALSGLYAEKHTNASGTKISFKIKNAGISVNGSFKNVEADVVFDDQNEGNIQLTGSAKANSVSTGISLRDTHLKEKEEFFNTKKYDVLKMKSVEVKKTSATTYDVTWHITIKGVTKKVTTKLTAIPKNGGYELSTTMVVNRKHWDLGGSSFTMSDLVTVSISAFVK